MIPTTEELFNQIYNIPDGVEWTKDPIKVGIEIAKTLSKVHVKAALEAAAEKVRLTDFAQEFLQEGANKAIDKNSILNAYPLNNIK